ncbi:unnamed protein product [Brachionus calyciflorus]|uniref:Uncharacterized protein n=1 Tax=Brachionus calyciflorus TaxID=104777 RepID=A0A813Q4U5_9BILA|nr:unnamed protein product [Brachionus calyciflorus]
MKDKCLVPVHVLNQTYSVEEIDIDIERPKIDEDNSNKKIQDSNITRRKSKQFVIEKSKVTITKTISKSTIQTQTSIPPQLITPPPKIIITDWDKKSILDYHTFNQNPAIDTTPPQTKPNNLDHIEINKQVCSKIVEEKTIDQFNDIESLDQNQQDSKTPSNIQIQKSTKKDFVIDTMSLSSDIRCKCCANRSPSSYCSRGSYVIVKNSQPANIQFEQFDSRLDETLEDESKTIHESDQNLSKHDDHDNAEYYLVNPKLNYDTNNNTSEVNKNLCLDKLNNYENDEYQLANLKQFSNKKSLLIEEIKDDTEKARDDPGSKQPSLLNNSNFNLFSNISSNNTPRISIIQNQELENPKSSCSETNPIIQDKDTIQNMEVITPKKIQPDYLYLYVSGQQCTEIFTQGKILLEKTIHDGKVTEGILLLSLPPSSSDSELLTELYGPGVPFDHFRVQCYIKLNRLLFDKSKYLHQISRNKFLCTKRIEFGNKFPKHEFRFRFNKP